MMRRDRGRGLVKSYGDVTALDGLDLAVPEGTVLGAARAQRRRQDHHRADPHHPAGARTRGRRDRRGARRRPRGPQAAPASIGLSGQYAAVDEHLTGFENLDMVGRLYHLGRGRSRERARELLERFDLADAGDRPAKTYSGGMRRRLDLAGAWWPSRRCCSSTSRPPASTRAAGWACGSVIADLVARRHHAAAHHAVPGGGRPARRRHRRHRPRPGDRRGHRRRAEGPGRAASGSSSPSPTPPTLDGVRAALLAGSASGEVDVDRDARRLTVPVDGRRGGAGRGAPRLDAAGITVSDVGLRRPTLDDVFLTLTGHAAEAADRRRRRRRRRRPTAATTEEKEVASR